MAGFTESHVKFPTVVGTGPETKGVKLGDKPANPPPLVVGAVTFDSRILNPAVVDPAG